MQADKDYASSAGVSEHHPRKSSAILSPRLQHLSTPAVDSILVIQGSTKMQTGTTVLSKNEDVESEAAETVASAATASNSASVDAPQSAPSVKVSEDAEDDDEGGDGWETTSVIEALLDDVNPYTGTGK